MEHARCTTLGTNLLWLASLIYLACGERGNEGIILRPKDESEFLAKKKTFEANIFKFFQKGSLFQSFGALQIKILTLSLCSTICDIYVSWKFFTCPTRHTPWKFLPLSPPPPWNFHWPSVGGGMDIFWNHTFKIPSARGCDQEIWAQDFPALRSSHCR